MLAPACGRRRAGRTRRARSAPNIESPLFDIPVIRFVIGAANRSAGRAVSSSWRLLELVRAHLAAETIFPVAD